MNSVRILICEDEQLIALDFKNRLERFGHVVTGIAATGKAAIELAARTKPDLVLMDIHLQDDILGTEVAGILSREYGIPSIFLTAYADNDTLDDAKQAMPLGFLVKPVTDNDLRAAIEIGKSFFDRHKQAELQARERLEKLQAAFISQDQDPAWYENQLHLTDVEKERVLTNVSGGVAHHLNNSLAVIMGSLEWLEHCGTMPAYEAQFLKRAQAGYRAAASLVNDLLLSSGNGLFIRQFCYVPEIVDRAVEHVRARMGRKCRIATTYPIDLESVMASTESLLHAFEAVLTNACEATAESEEIFINVDREYCEISQIKNEKGKSGWYAVIQVRDAGSGMEPAVLDRATEPFFSTRDNLNRPGMGLAVAKGVAQAIGGWLEVESAKNIGTTVRIFLPLCEHIDERQESRYPRPKLVVGGGAIKTARAVPQVASLDVTSGPG